jgi:hypothetical protein
MKYTNLLVNHYIELKNIKGKIVNSFQIGY